jgi:hypothetical protein
MLRKALLFLIVFVSGANVLALEILSSRVLGPKFGSTVFVWGSLIGVFLGGLSAGYYVGGHLADWRPSFARFGILLLLSGILVVTLPVYAFRVCGVIYDSMEMETVMRYGPLFASLALFLVPTTMLGTVSPYAVRLVADDPAKLGRHVGAMYALSTLGSIVGTLGTTFFLILWIGTRKGLYLLGGVQLCLALLALGYAWITRPEQ